MESKILEALGIDLGILIISVFVLIVILFILVISVNMKYTRLKTSYNSFMRGKDGKTMEDCIFERFEELEDLTALTMKNRSAIRKLHEEMQSNVQKMGIV